MYRGICTIPDMLAYRAPVNLPEDEVEGEEESLPVLIPALVLFPGLVPLPARSYAVAFHLT